MPHPDAGSQYGYCYWGHRKSARVVRCQTCNHCLRTETYCPECGQ